MTRLEVVATAPPTQLARLVEDYLSSCRARGLSPRTVDGAYGFPLRRVLLRWCATEGIERLDQLDQRAFDRLTSSLLEKDSTRGGSFSRHSVHSYTRAIRGFLAWARKEGESVSGQPQLPRVQRKVIDVLSRDEVRRLEDAAVTDRDKLIIRLLADTGMRVGELCGLRGDDVVRRGREAYLKVRGKGGRERLVPLPPTLLRRLERHQRGRPIDTSSDRLFLANRRAPSGDFEPLTESGVGQLVGVAAARAGLRRRVHPHLLRHTFVTEMLRRGMNPKLVADIAGHSSLRMIEQVYAHLSSSDAYDAMVRLLKGE